MKYNILKNKIYLYLTEFFSGMAIMAVELGASSGAGVLYLLPKGNSLCRLICTAPASGMMTLSPRANPFQQKHRRICRRMCFGVRVEKQDGDGVHRKRCSRMMQRPDSRSPF